MTKLSSPLLLSSLLVVAPACAGVQRSSAHWREITTPHFRINTDLDSDGAEREAQKLEQTRAALLAVAWPGAKDPPTRTDFIVASWKVLMQFMPVGADGVAARSQQFTNLIAYSPQQGIPDVVVHELSHDLSSWFIPIQPLWFAEGLACYLQTVRYDEGAHRVSMGRMPEDFVKLVKHKLVTPPSQLLATTTRPSLPRDLASFYVGSWLFTQYLLNYEGDRYGNFQVALGHLQDWRSAWDYQFSDRPQLDDAVRDALARFETTAVEQPIELSPVVTRERSLPAATVHGLIARAALIERARHLDLVKSEVDAALKLDAGEINALASSYYALTTDARGRLDLAKRAVSANPRSATAWLMLAGSTADEAERSRAVARAMELEPYAGAARLKSAEQKIRNGHPEAALEDTRLALRLSTPSVDLLTAYSISLAANNRCAEALAVRNNRVPGFSEGELDKLRSGASYVDQRCSRGH
jgi:hypothetical protein